MNDFASSADSIAEKLIAGGMDPDQAMRMALRMSQSREQASILGGVPVSPPVSDVPPVEEPILGGDTSKMFQRQPTIGQRLRDLPKDVVGAGEALASLGSAAALAPASMLYALRPGQKTQGSPLEFAQRNMYIPRTERGISHLQGLGEVLESLPQTGPLPELQAFTGLTKGIGTQLGQKARQAGEAMAPKVADVSEEFLRRQGLLMDVVRPKGTQVIGGNVPENIDTQLKSLRLTTAGGMEPAEALRQMNENYPEHVLATMEGGGQGARRSIATLEKYTALNNWVDRNLGNYIKKQMGTPDDPVRQLAESGVTHIQERYNEPGRITRTRRTEAGFPEEGMGVSPEARSWENLSDRVIDDYLAGSIQPQAGYMKDFGKLNEELNDLGKKVRERFFNERTERLIRQGETPERAKQYINDFLEGKNNLDLAKELNDPQLVKDYSTLRAKTNYARSLVDPEYESILRENPWIERLDPNTRLYTARTEGLQFDHVIDVLRDDLDSGRIRPEQLNRVSVADAVRRTYEFDQEMAKKAEQAQAELANKLLNESPFKTYDNGYKWVKLPDPAASNESMKLVQDIGCQGGWCTQSESNALYYGAHAEGNNLYVLMSPDKRVHAQIHVQSPEKPYDFDALMSDPQSKARASQAVREWRQRNPDVNGPLEDEQVYRALREAGIPEASPTISEIKPRANSWQSQMVADQIEKNPEYQQTIQRMLADFVRGTKYPVEYDLENTGLIQRGHVFTPTERDNLIKMGAEVPELLTMDEIKKLRAMQGEGWRPIDKDADWKDGGLVNNNNQIALGRESVQNPIPYKQGGSVNHKAVESARKAIEKALAKGGEVKMAGGGSMFGNIATGAAKAAKTGKGAAKTAKLTKFELAQKQAQINAAKPIEEGGLGLRMDNTAEERAAAQGYIDYYHGTERLDRLLEKPGLDPRRATSGPMPYGTTTRELASNYAMSKADTSRRAEDSGQIQNYFQVSPKDLGLGFRSPIAVERAWYFLSPEQKQKVMSLAPRVGYENLEDFSGKLMVHPEGVNATLNPRHWEFLMQREAKGNPLSALRHMWYESGQLVNDPSQLAEIYRLSGIDAPISQTNAPWTTAQGVLLGKARVKNPLDTSNTEQVQSLVPQLENAFRRDRSRTSLQGTDQWDKRARYTPKQWVDELKKDLELGQESYVWTSIPDKVTNELKRFGFDSIIDKSGKGGGSKEPVVIPFSPEQVRSRFAAFDPMEQQSPDLLKKRGGLSALRK